MNQKPMQHARCMWLFADLSEKLWVEEVNIACYIVNRSPLIVIECMSHKEE